MIYKSKKYFFSLLFRYLISVHEIKLFSHVLKKRVFLYSEVEFFIRPQSQTKRGNIRPHRDIRREENTQRIFSPTLDLYLTFEVYAPQKFV